MLAKSKQDWLICLISLPLAKYLVRLFKQVFDLKCRGIGILVNHLKGEFDWLVGANASEIDFSTARTLAVQGNSSPFYGSTKRYFWLWIILPLAVAFLKLSSIESRVFGDPMAWLFVGGFLSLFLGPILLLTRKTRKYFANLRERNGSHEIVLLPDALAISSGEVTRGEANAGNFWRNGFRSTVMASKADFFLIPFASIKSFSLNGHRLTITPKDPTKNIFEITVGDMSQDAIILSELGNYLSTKTKREAADTA